jgi:hypothetical protein
MKHVGLFREHGFQIILTGLFEVYMTIQFTDIHGCINVESSYHDFAASYFIKYHGFTLISWHLKNAVFWDVAPCRSYVNRRFGGTYRLHLQGSSETSVYTRSTGRNIPVDALFIVPAVNTSNLTSWHLSRFASLGNIYFVRSESCHFRYAVAVDMLRKI